MFFFSFFTFSSTTSSVSSICWSAFWTCWSRSFSLMATKDSRDKRERECLSEWVREREREREKERKTESWVEFLWWGLVWERWRVIKLENFECVYVLCELYFTGSCGCGLDLCLDLIWVGVFLVLDHPTVREVR